MLFPGVLAPITDRPWPTSVALVQSLGENRMLGIVAQIDPRVDTPGPADLYRVGAICVMHKAVRVPGNNYLLVLRRYLAHPHGGIHL